MCIPIRSIPNGASQLARPRSWAAIAPIGRLDGEPQSAADPGATWAMRAEIGVAYDPDWVRPRHLPYVRTWAVRAVELGLAAEDPAG